MINAWFVTNTYERDHKVALHKKRVDVKQMIYGLTSIPILNLIPENTFL